MTIRAYFRYLESLGVVSTYLQDQQIHWSRWTIVDYACSG